MTDSYIATHSTVMLYIQYNNRNFYVSLVGPHESLDLCTRS